MAIIAKDSSNVPRLLLVDSSGNIQAVISDGTDTATVTADGYLDVKTHTPENCFASDYTDAQSQVAILTPTSGKKIRVVQVYVSTKTTTTDVTLEFATSGTTAFKLYTTTRAAATGNIVCGEGATNEALSLTCGAGTFVSVAYDEVT